MELGKGMVFTRQVIAVEGGLIAAEKRRIETPFFCAWIFFRPSR
jgi:hypothetical protein